MGKNKNGIAFYTYHARSGIYKRDGIVVIKKGEIVADQSIHETDQKMDEQFVSVEFDQEN